MNNHLIDFQVKVFDLKYIIAISINLTSDLEMITKQMEKFEKIYHNR